MKKLLLLLTCCLSTSIYGQKPIEKSIKTEVSEVTVFMTGAQITRKKAVQITPGKTIIKFTNLSPFIDAKSIQVKAKGQVTVLSVNHQQNYVDKLEKSQELKYLESHLKEVTDKITLENTHLEIISSELSFLEANKNVGGKNNELSVVNLKNAATYYSSKLTALKLKEIERNKKVKQLTLSRNDLIKQINTLSSKKEFAKGEILVKIDSKITTSLPMELTYVVKNAGWYPTYDIRAKNVNEPIEVVYKANVKQDTKVDWKNVKLKMSSSNPNNSGVASQLKPYFINYNNQYANKRKYESYYSVSDLVGRVINGVVRDQSGPLPGVNIIITGSSIGTATDFDGNFTLTIPEYAKTISFSYMGYKNLKLPINQIDMDVVLEEDASQLDEVVVVGYGSTKKRKGLRKNYSTVSSKDTNKSISMPLKLIENQTTVEFEIKMPYTIKSDNKNMLLI